MNIFRIIGVSSFLLTYCLAVGLGCFTALKVVHDLPFSSGKSTISLGISGDHYGHSGIIQRFSSNTALKVVDKVEDKFPTLGKVSGNGLERLYTEVNQPMGFWYRLPVRLRKADLIFPFHYFW